MIPQTDTSWQTQNWQEQMINAVRDAKELCSIVRINPSDIGLSETAAIQFPIMVPRAFIQKMERGNPKDPLLLQVLNSNQEDLRPEGYSTNPLNESSFNVAPGLIHKYHGRVLMIVSGKCAVNCRYCFRRSFPYNDNNPSRSDWLQAFDYIAKDKSITEVIFSGGDPLSAPDRHLSWIVDHLEKIKHLKRLRIHTRFPVVIPERICDAFLKWVEKTKLKIQLVLHINHPNEINNELVQAIIKLRPYGINVLNQSVLLKDINDNLETQIALQEKSNEAGILPYYLHCLDPIEGASHFDVNKIKAESLIKEMRVKLPGYLVPRLAVEIPGEASKTVLK